MTENSIIANYIKNNPGTWEADFEAKNIRVRRDGPYAIFNYGIDCDFTDPVVQEARGIILDEGTLDVMCWPFRKFGNWNEEYADEIEWNTARVQEKIDGSIVKLWWDAHAGAWAWSTNAVIFAENASVPRPSGGIHTYLDLIQGARNYSQVMDVCRDKGMTYIFELTSPMNEVVVHHGSIRLWHIGTRDKRTGEEHRPCLGLDGPAEYPLHSFDACMEAAKRLNPDKGVVTQEGYVVVDGAWRRIKIKSPGYLAVHHMLGNGVITKEKALNILDAGLVGEIRDYPQAYAVVKWYEYQMAEFELAVSEYIAYVRGLYEETGRSRKAVAAAIKKDALATFGFKALGNDKTAREIIAGISRSLVIRQYREYTPQRAADGLG